MKFMGVSRILFYPIIYLCDQPEAPRPKAHRDGPPLASYLILLRLGFALHSALQRNRWSLTPPFHPYPDTHLAAQSGRFVSVALSVAPVYPKPSRPYQARQPALWSPDFPPLACTKSDRSP